MGEPRRGATALGRAELIGFRDRVGQDELRRTLGTFGGADAAWTRLRAVVGDALDPAERSDRAALLAWLRAWGCRHLRRADEGRSSAAFARWWRRWAESLPPIDASLVELSRDELARLEGAYASLASLRAAARTSARGEVAVAFGDTAAAKALFAVRPWALPPWDEPIRLAFGSARHDGALYRRYVEGCGDALRGCAARLGVAVDELPARLGRPAATPPRLMDEYLWLRTRPSHSR